MIETDIQTQIMIALSECGFIPIRLNSGKAWQGDFVNGVILHPRAIKLCPPGTSDVLAILPCGKVAWIECKTLTGRQRDAQKKFQAQLEAMGHKYYVCRSQEEIFKIFGKKA